MGETMNCPVCKETGASKTSLLAQRYDCLRCGGFILPDKYGQLLDLFPRQRALLSHTLRRMQPVRIALCEIGETFVLREMPIFRSPIVR